MTSLTSYVSYIMLNTMPWNLYCSGATFTVAVAPLLLTDSSGDGSAATFLAAFLELFATATFNKRNTIFPVHFS